MNVDFDLNRRIDFLLNNTKSIKSIDCQRVVDIALPFINMHAGAGRVAGVSIGLTRVIAILRKDAPALERAFELVPMIAAIAITTLFPVFYYSLSQGLSLANHQWKLGCHLWRLEGKDAAKELFLSASQLVHVLSSIYVIPELLFISLLMQAIAEAAEAVSEYKEGKSYYKVAAAAKIALCVLRSREAASHGSTLHRNYFGKKLTSELWRKIYWENRLFKSSSEEIDIEAILKKEWISSHIKEVDFSDHELHHVVFQNMRFRNCNFTEASFDKSKFQNISFNSCNFDKAIWINTVCQNLYFNQSSFKHFGMIHCNGSDLSFDEADLSFACFNSSTLDRISIAASTLKETSFLFAKVKNSEISESTLEDVFFASSRPAFQIDDCKEIFSDKPIVAMSWDFKNSGMMTPMIYQAIEANGAITIRFEEFPDEIDPALLKQEVTSGLEEIEKNFTEDMLSRPRELLKRATPLSQIGRIRDRAEELSRYVDGFSLPGGSDVEPAFYGQKKEPYTYCESDMRRSMTEFSVLNQAYDKKMPTMGTCRGSQMLNVFMGGDLTQHVGGHSGYSQELHWTNSSYTNRFRPLIGDNMIGLSMHHQASRRMGQDLEVVLEHKGIPKLFTSRDGTFLGSQFHPEEYLELSDELEEILRERLSYYKEETIAMFRRQIADNQSVYRYFIGLFGATARRNRQ